MVDGAYNSIMCMLDALIELALSGQVSGALGALDDVEEALAKLAIEHGVDDRVDGGLHVAEIGQVAEVRLKASAPRVRLVLAEYGAQHVDETEGQPGDHERYEHDAEHLQRLDLAAHLRRARHSKQALVLVLLLLLLLLFTRARANQRQVLQHAHFRALLLRRRILSPLARQGEQGGRGRHRRAHAVAAAAHMSTKLVRLAHARTGAHRALDHLVVSGHERRAIGGGVVARWRRCQAVAFAVAAVGERIGGAGRRRSLHVVVNESRQLHAQLAHHQREHDDHDDERNDKGEDGAVYDEVAVLEHAASRLAVHHVGHVHVAEIEDDARG